jgi:hypothetical protein
VGLPGAGAVEFLERKEIGNKGTRYQTTTAFQSWFLKRNNIGA